MIDFSKCYGRKTFQYPDCVRCMFLQNCRIMKWKKDSSKAVVPEPAKEIQVPAKDEIKRAKVVVGGECFGHWNKANSICRKCMVDITCRMSTRN